MINCSVTKYNQGFGCFSIKWWNIKAHLVVVLIALCHRKLFWLDAWHQTLRSINVDNFEVTLDFDFRSSLGGRVLFGLAMTSHDTGYVSTWHAGDVIEVNVTSSSTRRVHAASFSSDVVFSLAYSRHQSCMYRRLMHISVKHWMTYECCKCRLWVVTELSSVLR